MAAESSPEPEGALRAEAAAQAAPGEGAARAAAGPILRGATVAPGLVMGRVHRQDHDLARGRAERVPLDEVDVELNRFRQALDAARLQLMDLKARLAGKVRDEDARILDTHLTYLRDSAFIADVENLILNEQMPLEGAIAKVVGDFDRIFRLVQNETLRQSAVDLRDVGIRVLRNIDPRASERSPDPPRDYVLVGRELSIVDMFNAANEHVRGIVTQAGGLTSHAAIFARSMRIPTLAGVEGLLDAVHEGDFVILDATEGSLRVNPDELVRAQYAEATRADAPPVNAGAEARPEWARLPLATKDGEEIPVETSAGNLPEVEQASALGVPAIGLYRTELLFLTDATPPSREALVQHYAAVVRAARGRVTFRLLSVDSSLGLRFLHDKKERNPSLGRVGIRALFQQPHVLRRQLQALLIAGSGAEIRIAVPFVADCADLRRVREILFEERMELRRTGERFQAAVPVGVVLETPSSLLGMRDLAAEADFLLVNLDGLQQHLMAMDREDPELGRALEDLHPYVLRALAKVAEVAGGAGRELAIFGAGATQPDNVSLLIGAGFRRFVLPPIALREFALRVGDVDAKASARATRARARSTSLAETRFRSLAEFRHGYARP
jgi:phosphotransferase system enzyme I (PtsI)